MDRFEGMTGAPSGVFGLGFISVVDFYLGLNPNPPGSPVASPGSGWNNAGSSNFNYAEYFPSTSTFIGANVGGDAGYASTSMHFGSEFGSSMC